MITELKMAELLCTRLCHDLTGPIGAVANGAEFLSEEGFDLQSQAVELIATSAGQAVSRLQFYRKAYGRINDDGEIDLAEQKKITQDFFANSKITLDWPEFHAGASGASVSNKKGRLLLNMIIIAAACLLRGGTLSIRIHTEGQTRMIEVLASGIAIKWDAEIERALKGAIPLDDLAPKTAQAEMTRKLAEELGARLEWEVTPTFVNLAVIKPLAETGF